MFSFVIKRFKSEAAPSPSNSALNKKLLEAFASIIDKGTFKAAYSKPASPLEPIHRFNVDSTSTSITMSKVANTHSSLIPDSLQPVVNRKNPPDIFKRNKMSPINLHKVAAIEVEGTFGTNFFFPECLFNEQNFKPFWEYTFSRDYQ